MAEAVDLAKLHGTGPVNEALERCASYGRFADGDLASILAHQQTATVIPLPARVRGALAAALDPQLGGIRGDELPADPADRPRAVRRSEAPACRTICGPLDDRLPRDRRDRALPARHASSRSSCSSSPKADREAP